MVNWRGIRDRISLWSLGLIASAALLGLAWFFQAHAAVIYTLALLTLLAMPLVIHPLTSTRALGLQVMTYWCYLILLLQVAGPSLPHSGVAEYARSLGTHALPAIAYILIQTAWLALYPTEKQNAISHS